MTMKQTKERFVGASYDELLEENAKLRGKIVMAYDLVSEAWGDVQSPAMLIEFISRRKLVLAELEDAMKLLCD